MVWNVYDFLLAKLYLLLSTRPREKGERKRLKDEDCWNLLRDMFVYYRYARQ